MKTISFFFIIAAMLLIAGCNPKAETNKDQGLADSLLKVSDNAYNSKDAQIITNLFADDALMIVNGKNIWSKDSIYALFKDVASFTTMNYKSYLGPTTTSPDMVQMQRYFTVEAVMGGSTLKGKGIVSLIWKKQADNSWKIVTFLEHADMKPY